jgi:hypothetical protein
MAGEGLAWSGSPFSVLRTLLVLRRNQDQETRLCKTDYRLTVHSQPVLPPYGTVPGLTSATGRPTRNSDRDKPLAWFWGWRVGVGFLGVRCLQRPHSSHPGWAAESCSDFFIDCCRMYGNCGNCGNCGCSAVSTRQFFGTALRSQQHGVCRMMEDITSKR